MAPRPAGEGGGGRPPSSERRLHGPTPYWLGRGRELRGARAGAMATGPSSERRRRRQTCADPAAGAMAPRPAGVGGSDRGRKKKGGEREEADIWPHM